MPLRTYLVQEFENSGERQFFSQIDAELKEQFAHPNDDALLIGNLTINGCQIDALFVRTNAIAILEFKNYGGVIQYSENGPWKSHDYAKNLAVTIQSGSHTNPLQQVSACRNAWQKFLEDNVDQQELSSPLAINHVAGIVVFQQDIQFDDTLIQGKLRAFFRVCDHATIQQSLMQLHSNEVNLSRSDMDLLLRKLGLSEKQGFELESRAPVVHAKNVERKNSLYFLESILQKNASDSEIQRNIEFYRLLVEAESVLQVSANKGQHLPCTDMTSIEVQLNPGGTSKLSGIAKENIAKQYPDDYIVALPSHTYKHGYTLIAHVSAHEAHKDNVIRVHQESFKLSHNTMLQHLKEEEQVFELADRIDGLPTIQEKLAAISEELNYVEPLPAEIFVGTSRDFPYVRHLKAELRALRNKSPEALKRSVFGHIVSREAISELPTAESPDHIYSVSPINNSQAQAISGALTQPLTVITGPPGTGKSQVIVNTIVNALVTGKRVLFASKNNAAVDTVVTRMSELFGEHNVLRLGSKDHNKKHGVIPIRRAIQSDSDVTEARSKEQQTKSALETLLKDEVRIREQLELLETLPPALADLEEQLALTSQQLQNLEESTAGIVRRYHTLEPQLDAKHVSQTLEVREEMVFYRSSFWRRIQYWFVGYKRMRMQADFVLQKIPHEIQSQILETLVGVPVGKANLDELFRVLTDAATLLKDVQHYQTTYTHLRTKTTELEQAVGNARKQLQFIRDNEASYRAKLRRMPEDKRVLTTELVKDVLNFRQARADKALLQNYVDALVAEKNVSRIQGELNTSSQELLNTFGFVSVTSLSIRNALPLQKEMFDIAIIDEASQCDIPSALPLLYRAKSAVIVGDPQQLRHISGVTNVEQKYVRDLTERVSEKIDYANHSLFDVCDSLAIRSNIKGYFLDEHYRCHPNIIGYSSEFVYRIHSGRELVVRTKPDTRFTNIAGVVWIDVEGEADDRKKHNVPEARTTVSVAKQLREGFPGSSIGVVSPFRDQVTLINNLIGQAGIENVKADTIHKYQGSECDIIVLSLSVTHNSPESLTSFINRNVHLLNVAVTRARQSLVIVADRTFCLKAKKGSSQTDFLKSMASYYGQNGRVLNQVDEMTRILHT